MTRITAGRQAIDALSLKLKATAWFVGAILLAGSSIPQAVIASGMALFNLLVLSRCIQGDSYIRNGRNFARWLRTVEAALLCVSCALPEVRGGRFWMLTLPTILTDELVERSFPRAAILTIGVGTVSWIFNSIQGGPLPYNWGPLFGCIVTMLFAIMLARYRDIEERLLARNRRLTTLMLAANAVTDRDTEGTLDRGLQAAVGDLGAVAGAIHLLSDENPEQLRTASETKLDKNLILPETAELGQGLAGLAVSSKAPVVLQTSASEPLVCDGVGVDAKMAVSVPLVARTEEAIGRRYEEKAIGAISLVFTDDEYRVDGEDLALLTSLGSLLGAAVNTRLMENRQRATFLRTLESLATALEARDDYTRGHSQRVCEVSLLIGHAFSLNPDVMEEIRVGTILHDIGKIGVPDAILNKPGRLTPEEYAVMRQHPVKGWEICRPLRLSQPILTIIRNHHEKLDGAGYPDRLTGEQMSLPLRIVCAADAFDAMSSRRPYRGVLEISTVLAEMERCAGSQFDPTVVEVLRELQTSGALDALYADFWPLKTETAA